MTMVLDRLQQGKCRKGDGCTYAHGENEIGSQGGGGNSFGGAHCTDLGMIAARHPVATC